MGEKSESKEDSTENDKLSSAESGIASQKEEKVDNQNENTTQPIDPLETGEKIEASSTSVNIESKTEITERKESFSSTVETVQADEETDQKLQEEPEKLENTGIQERDAEPDSKLVLDKKKESETLIEKNTTPVENKIIQSPEKNLDITQKDGMKEFIENEEESSSQKQILLETEEV